MRAYSKIKREGRRKVHQWQQQMAAQLCPPFDGWVRAIGAPLAQKAADLCFVAGQAPSLRLCDGQHVLLRGHTVTAQMLGELLARLCGYSLYACQRQLAQGYLTLPGGFRAGFGGVFDETGLNPTQVQSVVLRIMRDCPGCAQPLLAYLNRPEASVLIASAPGMGKTTLLRDLVRALSQTGRWIGLCDERGEVAALNNGVPSLDVGPCTIVADGCAKAQAMARFVRAVHPDMIAADELGDVLEAQAVLEASKCGVAVLATAHGASMEDLKRREGIGMLLRARVFDRIALLGGAPGRLAAIYDAQGGLLR
jgi:stage III sporulation protein AA